MEIELRLIPPCATLATDSITLGPQPCPVGLIDVPTPPTRPPVIYIVKKEKGLDGVVEIEAAGLRGKIPGVGIPDIVS